jgi:FkbM family methyltransferase
MTARRAVCNASILFACGLFLWNTRDVTTFAMRKLSGATPCPWHAAFGGDPVRDRAARYLPSVTRVQTDGDLSLYTTPERSFWLPDAGPNSDGARLIAELVAEHQWMAEANSGNVPRPGDIVLDCGAHIGVFVHFALKRQAARVVAIEPDEQNVRCLHRNFPAEVAAGKVVIVPKGVWSSRTELRFATGNNSAKASAVFSSGGKIVTVPVDTIDAIAAQAKLGSVDYLKMDIEGAEPEALAGATAVLSTYRPRLMIAGYHRPDDYPVLPRIIQKANPQYKLTCGPCVTVSQANRRMVAPNVLYFE